MRLFVAVVPPVEALQGLSDAVAPVRGLPGADRLRWTTVEGWHLTLAFLGEVPAERLPELEAGLAGVAEVHAVHRLRISGAGRFGDRVLWAGVDGQTWALRRLAEAVGEVTAEVAGATDAYNFHPHLTLARAGSTGATGGRCCGWRRRSWTAWRRRWPTTGGRSGRPPSCGSCRASRTAAPRTTGPSGPGRSPTGAEAPGAPRPGGPGAPARRPGAPGRPPGVTARSASRRRRRAPVRPARRRPGPAGTCPAAPWR
ncbi:RNA 2',3'-cyclic phosphodiesterase [Kitasatospora aburaviensis]